MVVSRRRHPCHLGRSDIGDDIQQLPQRPPRTGQIVELEMQRLRALRHCLEALLAPHQDLVLEFQRGLAKLLFRGHWRVCHFRVPRQLPLQRLDHLGRVGMVLHLKLPDRPTPLLVLELLLPVQLREVGTPLFCLLLRQVWRHQALGVHPDVEAPFEEDHLLCAEGPVEGITLLRSSVRLRQQRRAAPRHCPVVQRQVPRVLAVLPSHARLLVALDLLPPQAVAHVRVCAAVVEDDEVALVRLFFEVPLDRPAKLVSHVEQHLPQRCKLPLDEARTLLLKLCRLLLKLRYPHLAEH
mmetsp:Transcript_64625/g.154230  ORF Transcript_64625/g.154230 Transcript_64625/m.154230 type:complete len:296 (+) Transcript_64625:1965-2852(+)